MTFSPYAGYASADIQQNSPMAPGAGVINWTPIATQVGGGFVNGWTSDPVKTAQIGLFTIEGIVIAVVKGIIRPGTATFPAFVLPAGYRPVPTTQPSGAYYFAYAGSGPNPSNTLIYLNTYFYAGYDSAGASDAVNPVTLNYSWVVKS